MPCVPRARILRTMLARKSRSSARTHAGMRAGSILWPRAMRATARSSFTIRNTSSCSTSSPSTSTTMPIWRRLTRRSVSCSTRPREKFSIVPTMPERCGFVLVAPRLSPTGRPALIPAPISGPRALPRLFLSVGRAKSWRGSPLMFRGSTMWSMRPRCWLSPPSWGSTWASARPRWKVSGVRVGVSKCCMPRTFMCSSTTTGIIRRRSPR